MTAPRPPKNGSVFVAGRPQWFETFEGQRTGLYKHTICLWQWDTMGLLTLTIYCILVCPLLDPFYPFLVIFRVSSQNTKPRKLITFMGCPVPSSSVSQVFGESQGLTGPKPPLDAEEWLCDLVWWLNPAFWYQKVAQLMAWHGWFDVNIDVILSKLSINIIFKNILCKK